MQVEVPLELYVAQWVLLAALGLLVVIAFRQLAYFRGLSAADVGGLDVGSLAPNFKYRMVSGGRATKDVTELALGSRALALMFGDPSCGACDAAISALERFSQSPEGGTWGTLLVTAATEEELSHSEKFRTSHLPLGIVDADVLQVLYQVQQMPLLYALDESGRVQAKGVVSDRQVVEKILSTGYKHPVSPRRVARRVTFEKEPGGDGTHN